MSQTSLLSLIAGILEVDPRSLSESSGMGTTEGWDSLKHFLIMTEIEQTFGVRLGIDQMERGATVGEIRAILAAGGVRAPD